MEKLLRILMIFMALHKTWSTVLVADQTMSRMVELTAKPPFCILHTDRGIIQNMVLKSEPMRLRQMSNAAIASLEKACKEKTMLSETEGGFIYPGTKWCGPGNRSSSYRDLGYHAAEDRCCREHDHCPHSLAPGQCKRGACNNGRFTRSHCDCDARFRRCLQALNTETANTLGAVFFNVVQVTCIKERRPCSEWQKCDNVWVFGKSKMFPFNPAVFEKRLIEIKTKLGNGLSENQTKELCSQWKFRPSDKYVPLMPLPSQYF